MFSQTMNKRSYKTLWLPTGKTNYASFSQERGDIEMCLSCPQSTLMRYSYAMPETDVCKLSLTQTHSLKKMLQRVLRFAATIKRIKI